MKKRNEKIEYFLLEFGKPKPKQSQSQPIGGKVDIISQLELLVQTGMLRKRRENASEQIVIAFSFESDWLRRWSELSGTITDQS